MIRTRIVDNLAFESNRPSLSRLALPSSHYPWCLDLAKYQANVTKRGHVKTATQSEKSTKPSVSPYLVGFLLAMLCGGAIFEVLRLFGASIGDESS
jgi:hypothetical protein